MARWAFLLALTPGTGLGFSPSVHSGVTGGSSTSVACWNHASVGAPAAFRGSPVQALARSLAGARRGRTSSGVASMALGSTLVEQPVTAEKAIALIEKAKAIVEADMGIKAVGMLSEEFKFLWQFNGVLSRDAYLAEGKGPYATLRTALPDLFWNSYDYRVDKYDENRVWLTTRVTGTHNGPLVFDGKEYPASGKRVEAAPECVSLVFDEESGLCTKMTGGFCLDRGAGNTGPAGGIWGILQAIGEPVSAFKYFPPLKVLIDVVGPTFRPKKISTSAKMPFREAIAIALAKQVLTAGRDDPEVLADLLADDVQIYAPILGPLKKKGFVQSATVDLVDFFAGLDVNDNLHDARVDPFEPSRVWVTVRPTAKVIGKLEAFGTEFKATRDSFVGGPQTLSVTFDSDGYASKITLGFPMDTDIGDADGLTNFQGILAGVGAPVPEILGLSRPFPESIRRLVNSITPEGLKPKSKSKPKPKAKVTASPKAESKPTATASVPSPPASKSRPSVTASKPVAVKAKAVIKKPAPPAKTSAPSKPAPKPKAKPVAAAPEPKAAPKTKPVLKPKAVPQPAAKAVSKPGPAKKSSSPAAAASKGGGDKKEASPEVKSKGASSPFGGLFGFGAKKSASKSPEDAVPVKGAAVGKAPSSETKNFKEVPKKAPAPAKKPAKVAPAPAPKPPAAKKPPAPKPAAAGVSFSPQLAEKLGDALGGSSLKVDQLAKRTELFARGGISAMDYWRTLKTSLGSDGAQNLGPDIIGALPAGNQKKAILKIFAESG